MSDFKMSKFYSRLENIIIVILASLMFTPVMVKGVKPFLSLKFVPDITIFWYIFFIYLLIVVLYGFFIMHKSIKNNYKNKIVFYSFLVGWSGGFTTFFPYLNINFYPILTINIAIYSTVITYVTLKHRISDIFAISQGFIKALSVMVLVASYFILSTVYSKFVTDKIFYIGLCLSFIYFVISLEMHPVLIKSFKDLNIDFGFGANYRKEDIIKTINDEILDVVSMDALTNKIQSIVEERMNIKINSFYISNKIKENNSKITNFTKYFGLDIESQIIHKLEKNMDNKNLNLSIKLNESYEELRHIMIDGKFEAYVPFIFNNQKMGFMLLQARKNKKDFFFYDDMEIFDDLVMKVGIALERIKSHMQFLQEKERTLQALAGSIAHEMRNPLAAISLAVQNNKVIIDDVINKKEAKVSDCKEEFTLIDQTADMALSSIKRAGDIIDIILNDMKGKEIDPKTFIYIGVKKIINRSILEYGYKNNAEKKRVKVEIEDDFIFNGSKTLFIYIIFNLIKNSLYYIKTYPKIMVTIYTEKSDREGFNKLVIRDTGPGISKKLIAELFGEFVTSGKKGGTGLGLVFCRRAIKSFDGDIICESELGKWTKFILYFPKLDKRQEEKAKEEISLRHSRGSKSLETKNRILLVDDYKINITGIKADIEGYISSFSCDLITDPKEAIERVRNNKYNLILMDLDMPEISGFECTEAIRKFNNQVPVLAYTSHKTQDVVDKTIACGMVGFMTKPCDKFLLLRNVAKWCLSDYSPLFKQSNAQLKDLLKNKNILIIDDQDVNLMMTSRLFGRYVKNTITANNGIEALKIIKKKYQEIDIILTDINMPEMGGDEMIRRLRKIEHRYLKAHKPAVAITGESDQKIIHNILKSGIDDYLVKGCEANHMIQIVALWANFAPQETKHDLKFIENVDCSIDGENGVESKAKILKADIIDDNYSKHVIFDKTKLSMLDGEDLKEVLMEFKNSIGDVMKKLKTAKSEGNIDDLFQQTHALKGICGSVGFERVQFYVTDINEIFRKKEFPNDNDWLKKLDNMVIDIIKIIDSSK
ncbi:response regulator [Flavobacteriaceae bacterium]|nr:response regulator [Flavobacteriaceae bacterium]